MAETVTLAPPGAGIPLLHRLAMRWRLRRLPRRMDEARALALFDQEATKLLALAKDLTPEQLARRVLVPPQRGLEDSSRYWSVAMVLEHLVIVGDAMAGFAVALSRGEIPPGRVAIAEVKPAGTQEALAAVAAFEAMLARVHALLATRHTPLAAKPRYAHPWFGPLTAHQWMCLLALHQRVHRQQAEAIVTAARNA